MSIKRKFITIWAISIFACSNPEISNNMQKEQTENKTQDLVNNVSDHIHSEVEINSENERLKEPQTSKINQKRQDEISNQISKSDKDNELSNLFGKFLSFSSFHHRNDLLVTGYLRDLKPPIPLDISKMIRGYAALYFQEIYINNSILWRRRIRFRKNGFLIAVLNPFTSNDELRCYQRSIRGDFHLTYSKAFTSTYDFELQKDNQVAVSCDHHSNITMWNTNNGEVIQTFNKEILRYKLCTSLTFNHDDTYLAMGFNDNILIWNLDLNKLEKTLIILSYPRKLIFGNKGRKFAALLANKRIAVWNTENWEPISEKIIATTDILWDIYYNPQNQLVALSYNPKRGTKTRISLIFPFLNKELIYLEEDKDADISFISLCPSGNYLAVCLGSKKLVLRDITDNFAKIHTIESKVDLCFASFHPVEKILVVGEDSVDSYNSRLTLFYF